MNKFISILVLSVLAIGAKAQVVNWVENDYNADLKIYFTNYKYEADVIAFKTPYKYEAQMKPGYWWWDENLSNSYVYQKMNIKSIKYKYQADFIVYITTFKHEIKLSKEYINVIEEWKQ